MSGGLIQKSRGEAKPFLFVLAAVAALGGFLFGYDTGVISGALLFIKPAFQRFDVPAAVDYRFAAGGCGRGRWRVGGDRVDRRALPAWTLGRDGVFRSADVHRGGRASPDPRRPGVV
jgi:hypothetical protein